MTARKYYLPRVGGCVDSGSRFVLVGNGRSRFGVLMRRAWYGARILRNARCRVYAGRVGRGPGIETIAGNDVI